MPEVRFYLGNQYTDASSYDPGLVAGATANGVYTGPDGFYALATFTSRYDFYRILDAEGLGIGYSFSAPTSFLVDFSDNRGNLSLAGGANGDVLRGGAGDDLLEGGAGGDVLDGGAGTDTVSYANAAAGIRAFLVYPEGNTGEAAGDTYRGIENLRGSAFDDVLFGNEAYNVLEGGAGADSLTGFGVGDMASYQHAGSGVVVDLALRIQGGTGDAAGDRLVDLPDLLGSAYADRLSGDGKANVLIGAGGSDVLNGRGGIDTLAGGGGNDRYVVDEAYDEVIEARGEGSDQVLASTTFALADGVAVERLSTTRVTGNATIDLAGNAYGQRIDGNQGTNRLDGLDGRDTLYGYGGNDVFNGGRGNDVMVGGGGNDVFTFNTALDARTNVDTLFDFANATGNDDLFVLDDAVFAGLTRMGPLSADLFAANAAGRATDANDRIAYETDTGRLFYDADGSGAGVAVQFATLVSRPTLTAADFYAV